MAGFQRPIAEELDDVTTADREIVDPPSLSNGLTSANGRRTLTEP